MEKEITEICNFWINKCSKTENPEDCKRNVLGIETELFLRTLCGINSENCQLITDWQKCLARHTHHKNTMI